MRDLRLRNRETRGIACAVWGVYLS